MTNREIDTEQSSFDSNARNNSNNEVLRPDLAVSSVTKPKGNRGAFETGNSEGSARFGNRYDEMSLQSKQYSSPTDDRRATESGVRGDSSDNVGAFNTGTASAKLVGENGISNLGLNSEGSEVSLHRGDANATRYSPDPRELNHTGRAAPSVASQGGGAYSQLRGAVSEQIVDAKSAATCKLEPSTNLPFDNIKFDVDKAVLSELAQETIESAVAYLKLCSIEMIEIGGHTDSVMSSDYNHSLSQRRAEVVLNYMVELGFDSAKVRAHGYGEEQPVASNDSVEDRAKNRRVEIKIISFSE
ncbi:OmpA family protein [Zhongshania guokunii]|uniref:OmpA family protein n=1 Tax=Zhongshania guokunii TaxID=641783 RepID=A0ABV3UB32_9GAMM